MKARNWITHTCALIEKRWLSIGQKVKPFHMLLDDNCCKQEFRETQHETESNGSSTILETKTDFTGEKKTQKHKPKVEMEQLQ